ncbi:MAG: copper amine oxidase N-terminal domain-containing protein [Armatimonadetes bacterium]|nr:copper amine oxidase N-terminal domain-containing protein [Armatimonadota bacterium]
MRSQPLGQRLSRSVGLVLALLGMTSSVFAASVVINGAPLITSRSPVNVSGSILLPMRDVFEALNAEVKWFAAQQMILAIRGNTTIELTIGVRTAKVNGASVPLPVAPMLIGGSTYVPLRFPAEAFGGTVKWDPALQTAFIDIPLDGTSGGATALPPTEGPPTVVGPPAVVEPPVPELTSLEGTVVQLFQGAVPSVVLQLSGSDNLRLLQLPPGTPLTRGPADGGAAPAQAADLQVGDLVQAQVDAEGKVQQLAASYGEKTGKIAAVAANTLLFEDGSALSLSSNVRVSMADGSAASLQQVTAGSEVTARFQPMTRTIWQIELAAAPTPPPASEKVEILTIGLSNPGTAFKSGDVLSIQLQGTPGGEASASISNRVAPSVALPEAEPGVYRADFTVPAGVEAKGLRLVGNLTKGGKRARPVMAVQTLTIDNTAPVFADSIPAPDSVVENSSPSIEIGYSDGEGSGVDAASVTLHVDGEDVTADTAVGDGRAIYNAQDLAPGKHRVQVRLQDLAGNEATNEWAFRVSAPAAAAIAAVWHNARGVLLLGQTVTVSARVAEPGGVATFSIGDWKRGLPMTRDGNTLNYRGTYTVQAGDQVTDAEVTVRYRPPGGKAATMAATNRLTIDATLPNELQIASPADGSAVTDPIVVEGTAPPGSTVRLTISFRTRLITTVTGQLWQGNLKADSEGRWQSPEVSPEVFLGKANEYTVLAQLLDASGAVVSEQTVKLTK